MSRHAPSCIAALLTCVVLSLPTAASAQCTGKPHVLDYVKFNQRAYLLADGSLATWARASVNVDGMARAYHRDGKPGGGLISLCNAGKPYPTGRPPYNASEDNAACSQFAKDWAAIRNAGWKNPEVGAIHWFGILGRDSVKIGNEIVKQVVPVEQPGGSGFYVSPTSLEDAAHFPKKEDQRRYINAEVIAAAVIRKSEAMDALGIVLGTFGVAIHREHRVAVPFIVGDHGPRIGEASYAMGRALKDYKPEAATRQNVYSGHVDKPDILWIFFGGDTMKPPYTPEKVRDDAQAAFTKWGGWARLDTCLSNSAIPKAQ